MKRLATLVALLSFSSVALGAELTRILSSFEDDKPFRMSIEVGYQRTQEKSQLVRETHQNGQVVDMPEVNFLGTDQRLVIDARIGLWRDLEFHFLLPYIFAQNRSWRYAGGTSDANSTVFNNCLQPNGDLLAANCPTTGLGSRPLFTPSSDSYRGGLGNLTFGIAYALFNQARDDTKPTWIVGLDYTAPTAAMLDPTVPTDPQNRGNIGDKVHRFKLYTALSRRIGRVEPYFQLHYTLPLRGSGWYSNCDHPLPTILGRYENCGVAVWTREETGIHPAHVGGAIVGSEFVLDESPRQHRKYAVDLRALATYVSPGRYYNEMSDLFRKLLYNQDYLEVGGAIGGLAQPVEIVSFQTLFSLAYQSDHILTYEVLGRDLDGDGAIDSVKGSKEVNPNFDFRTDMASRRFKATHTFVFRIDLSARVNF
jgi:hypothetical protein